MDKIDFDFIKGKFYSKEELNKQGYKYIKETTITLFYRKECFLYIFDAKPNKKNLHKFLSFIED